MRVVMAVMFVVLVLKVPVMPLVVHVLWCRGCGGCLSERDRRKAREQCGDEQRLDGGHVVFPDSARFELAPNLLSGPAFCEACVHNAGCYRKMTSANAKICTQLVACARGKLPSGPTSKEHMNGKFRWLGIWFAVVAATTGAQAAEIVLERSAVEKLVMQTMFSNAGRYELQRGACYAYLESPSVELKDGRIRIRSRLSSRLGVDLGNSCVGVSITSWTVVSGRPAANGGSVRLEDLRIDSVDDPTMRLVLESGLLPALPRAIELDVLKAVRSMLQNSGAQLQTSVDAFQIESVLAGDDRLAVKFNFRLVAR